jgi:hypothetical protein
MSPSVLDLRYEWPQRRLPIFFIVDDPAPCINLGWYEHYEVDHFKYHVRDVPNSFTCAWADLIEEFGVRGKFTVLPVPAGIGRIDRPLPEVEPAAQEEFLRIIRERVSPQMDIGIEFLTHFLIWDIQRERPIHSMEKTMGRTTDPGRLAEYFAYGLRILDGLGLDPTGVTSPGDSCREIEREYQRAVREAVREVRGLPIAWYFLHVDDESPVVLPRIMSLDAAKGEACVTMVSGGNDPSWETQLGRPSNLDILITADGQRGRLVDLYRNGSVIGFHTHWQSLFSNGRGTGLADLRVTLSRIREYFGDGVRWIKCSELARVVAAQAVARPVVTSAEDGVSVTLTSTIACSDFTCSLVLGPEPRSVSVGATDRERPIWAPLRRLTDPSQTLEPNSWRWWRGELSWCADLPAGEVTVRVTG